MPRGRSELTFRPERWIDPSKFGWFSSDHHIHAAGCSHYQNPTEGVLPSDMNRQVRGENLNIAAVLTWGPDYYYQKQFFTGHDDHLSTPSCLMHYDLEVSGFPSSHAGHLVLLGLHQQDYPGTKRIEHWPSWDLPILRWAKSQRATVGFAHSGWGLQVSGNDLPSYQMPAFDGIGANEYIADVTQPGAVDFISAGDTPYVWELSIWYHTLNVGFRTRISGETDFPCIYDGRVGQGRGYAKIDGALTYAKWLDAIRNGATYVSDGRSHLMDFSVNGTQVGMQNSEVRLDASGQVTGKCQRGSSYSINFRMRRFGISAMTKNRIGVWSERESEIRNGFRSNWLSMGNRLRGRNCLPMVACMTLRFKRPSAKAVGWQYGLCRHRTLIPFSFWWAANPSVLPDAAPNGVWPLCINAGRKRRVTSLLPRLTKRRKRMKMRPPSIAGLLRKAIQTDKRSLSPWLTCNSTSLVSEWIFAGATEVMESQIQVA